MIRTLISAAPFLVVSMAWALQLDSVVGKLTAAYDRVETFSANADVFIYNG